MVVMMMFATMRYEILSTITNLRAVTRCLSDMDLPSQRSKSHYYHAKLHRNPTSSFQNNVPIRKYENSYQRSKVKMEHHQVNSIVLSSTYPNQNINF